MQDKIKLSKIKQNKRNKNINKIKLNQTKIKQYEIDIKSRIARDLDVAVSVLRLTSDRLRTSRESSVSTIYIYLSVQMSPSSPILISLLYSVFLLLLLVWLSLTIHSHALTLVTWRRPIARAMTQLTESDFSRSTSCCLLPQIKQKKICRKNCISSLPHSSYTRLFATGIYDGTTNPTPWQNISQIQRLSQWGISGNHRLSLHFHSREWSEPIAGYKQCSVHHFLNLRQIIVGAAADAATRLDSTRLDSWSEPTRAI